MTEAKAIGGPSSQKLRPPSDADDLEITFHLPPAKYLLFIIIICLSSWSDKSKREHKRLESRDFRLQVLFERLADAVPNSVHSLELQALSQTLNVPIDRFPKTHVEKE